MLRTHGLFIRRLENFLELSEVRRFRSKNSSANGTKEALSLVPFADEFLLRDRRTSDSSKKFSRRRMKKP